MIPSVSRKAKPLAWLHGEVKTPPFGQAARIEAGYLLRELQRGTSLGMPHSRPMPAIGARCHELRVVDERETWRIIYRVDADAIVIVEVFAKKTTHHASGLGEIDPVKSVSRSKNGRRRPFGLARSSRSVSTGPRGLKPRPGPNHRRRVAPLGQANTADELRTAPPSLPGRRSSAPSACSA